MKSKTLLILENNALRLMLQRLVRECSPPRLPDDHEHHGVTMPSKETLEQARTLAYKP